MIVTEKPAITVALKKAIFSQYGVRSYGGKKRGGILEVDRKDNTKGYEIDNCVLACAVCNMAKSDKFTYNEFRRVGGVIGKIWRERKVKNHQY